MKTIISRIVAALLVPCLLLDSVSLMRNSYPDLRVPAPYFAGRSIFRTEAIVPPVQEGFTPPLSAPASARHEEQAVVLRELTENMKAILPIPEISAKPDLVASDVWLSAMASGIEELREHLKVHLGSDLLLAFRRADGLINQGLKVPSAGAVDIWGWRRLHLLIIGQFFQNLAITQNRGGPVFRAERNIKDRPGERVFYFQSSHGPVRARLILRLEAHIPLLKLELELLGPIPHVFEQVRIGCDAENLDMDQNPGDDFDHTWPHLDIGPAEFSPSVSIVPFVSHFFVSPFPLPEEQTGTINNDEVRRWLPRVQESLRQSLIRLDHFIEGTNPVSDQDMMARRAESRASPPPSLPSPPVVSESSPETANPPAVRAPRPWRNPSSVNPARSGPQRARRPHRVSREQRISRSWHAILRPVRTLGSNLAIACAAIFLVIVVIGSVWNIYSVRHPHSEMSTMSQVASNRKKSAITSEPPMNRVRESATPSSETFSLIWPVVHLGAQKDKDFYINLKHQVSWMQWDWLHESDKPLRKHADRRHLTIVMNEILLVEGPLNKGFVSQVKLHTQFRGEINRDTGLVQPGVTGDVTYLGTVENQDLIIPMVNKAKDLQAEANRLYKVVQQNLKESAETKANGDTDMRIVKDLNARAATLRTLYRELQVELANRFSAVVGKPGGIAGAAMGSQIRLSLRAKFDREASSKFNRPGEYMDKYSQFLIADYVETWFRAKNEAFLYRDEHHVSAEALEAARMDVGGIQGLDPYLHERLAYARLKSKDHKVGDDEVRIQILLNALLPETISYVENGSRGPVPRELLSNEKDHLPVNRLVAEFIVNLLKERTLLRDSDGYLSVDPAHKQDLLNRLRRHEPVPDIGPYRPKTQAPDTPQEKMSKPGGMAPGTDAAHHFNANKKINNVVEMERAVIEMAPPEEQDLYYESFVLALKAACRTFIIRIPGSTEEWDRAVQKSRLDTSLGDFLAAHQKVLIHGDWQAIDDAARGHLTRLHSQMTDAMVVAFTKVLSGLNPTELTEEILDKAATAAREAGIFVHRQWNIDHYVDPLMPVGMAERPPPALRGDLKGVPLDVAIDRVRRLIAAGVVDELHLSDFMRHPDLLDRETIPNPSEISAETAMHNHYDGLPADRSYMVWWRHDLPDTDNPKKALVGVLSVAPERVTAPSLQVFINAADAFSQMPVFIPQRFLANFSAMLNDEFYALPKDAIEALRGSQGRLGKILEALTQSSERRLLTHSEFYQLTMLSDEFVEKLSETMKLMAESELDLLEKFGKQMVERVHGDSHSDGLSEFQPEIAQQDECYIYGLLDAQGKLYVPTSARGVYRHYADYLQHRNPLHDQERDRTIDLRRPEQIFDMWAILSPNGHGLFNPHHMILRPVQSIATLGQLWDSPYYTEMVEKIYPGADVDEAQQTLVALALSGEGSRKKILVLSANLVVPLALLGASVVFVSPDPKVLFDLRSELRSISTPIEMAGGAVQAVEGNISAIPVQAFLKELGPFNSLAIIGTRPRAEDIVHLMSRAPGQIYAGPFASDEDARNYLGSFREAGLEWRGYLEVLTPGSGLLRNGRLFTVRRTSGSAGNSGPSTPDRGAPSRSSARPGSSGSTGGGFLMRTVIACEDWLLREIHVLEGNVSYSYLKPDLYRAA